MRTFQKILKKSGLSVIYSAGFNPHMMLSFAAPLGVGEETTGDYADVDFAYRDRHEMSEQELYRLTDLGIDNDALPDPPSPEELVRLFNAAAPEGVRADAAVRVGLIKSSKAMALVRFASFELLLKDSFAAGYGIPGLSDALRDFLSREEILLRKKTKKDERDVNIRPLIAEAEAHEAPSCLLPASEEFSGKRAVRLVCAQGSSQNLKPSSVLSAFAEYLGVPFDPCGFRTVRLELYDGDGNTLLELGDPF